MKQKGSEHTLHLHGPKIDKYTIQKPFLFLSDDNEEVVYVTNSVNNPPPWFVSKDINLEVIDFEELFRLYGTKRLRIVLDASSLCRDARFSAKSFNRVIKLEEFVNQLCERRPTKCLCTYDMALLDPKMIRQIAMYHNNLLLTISDLTILSGDSVNDSELPENSFEEMVKNNLEVIVLALIQKRPMCGTDIMQAVHRDFNVFLSPGAVYPLLHTLHSRGLLRFEVIGKTKRYSPADDKTGEEMQKVLKEHIQVNKFLGSYLRRTLASD